MKKIILLSILFPALCFAQPGYINTIAGNGTNGFSGDGGPALSAQIGQALGLCADYVGNVYFADAANGRVRKIGTNGIINTIAGGGALTTDGIPATSASLNLSAGGDLTINTLGDLYLMDGNRIRKIDHATGIITTVAGTTTAGFSGDGGPATAAQLNAPAGIYIDASGNLYIGDEQNHRVRLVNTLGIISTYAGNGNSGYSGDGGPATSATLQSPDGLCTDAAGNLYFADRYNYRIRRVDHVTGIITTYAGTGVNGFSGDGGPATSARFGEPSDVCMDAFGNLYIADFHNGRVRKVDPSGIVTTFAGGGASMNDGIPATSASLTDEWTVGVDGNNNIYIPDRMHYRLCKVTGMPTVPTASSDSFSVYCINADCSGPTITIIPVNYSPALTVKTWFGDGQTQTDTFSAVSGLAALGHAYSNSGDYTLKYVLYDGNTAIDSLTSSYHFMLCQSMSVELYYDDNGNCIKDSGDIALLHSGLVEVDSNNVPVDTISAMSGFYYTAHGNAGDIYAFRVITVPTGYELSCPLTGVVYDTLGALFMPTRYIGFQCGTANSFDLSAYAVIPVTGVNDQWGYLYVQNNYCMPVNATLTLHYSPKYTGFIATAGGTLSGNTITWNFSSLTLTNPGLISFIYGENAGVTHPTIGDTVTTSIEITPNLGDTDITNNTEIIYDTVKAGCDPNEMWVSPEHCIPDATSPVQLKYTFMFENTGNDTAHNIYVLDTLPDNVDISSMRLLLASHPMYISKFKDPSGHNILKFDFPNINLLDSSHHGQCDGTVMFYINTQPGLVAGTHIYNRAGIYFDYNDVVMTNQVDNLIGCSPANVNNTTTVGAVPEVYPNPASGSITITADVSDFDTYTVFNSLGKTITEGELSQRHTVVRVKDLAPGLYFVNIKGKNGSALRKFLKM
jgi:uncharacterized repeat protein (TIGR01451 family)